MKTSQQHLDSVADEQAALWAARLDGDNLSSAHRAELDAWLAARPEHRPLLSRYCQFSADLEQQVPALVAAGVVTLPEATEPPRQRYRTLRRLTAVVLAAAAAIAAGVVTLRPKPDIESVAMASAQRGSRTLADGTRVELNANTSLRFENGRTERRVRLAGGEALFVVAQDSTRPFFVETPTGSVRVTGTTFNVRTESSTAALEVTVVEGSVQVHPGDFGGANSYAPLFLSAGEQFTARGGVMSTHVLSPANLEDALAWREGYIVFRATPLVEALARYARHHGCSIQAHPEIAGELVGGRYSIDDLGGFLDGIEFTLPVKVNSGRNGGVMVVPRP
jgi:transmembrane sensor